ncbi:acyl-CoA thioesterase/BAAT N-terminal domain-containing protein [Streptomyces sp. NPDC020681]|uniref:acyl-CoA thioesterase/BAAT N-terminal domain-containing protein n=1 Tax=Streptomyces sp. NPDC020681 TaxID=3365083 RepID=UPI0037B5FB26
MSEPLPCGRRIRVTGLHPGEDVTVASQAVDHKGLRWSARAVATADTAGEVDLAPQRSTAGTRRQADGMSL